MPVWQWAILFWAILWGFQSIGVWLQIRSYAALLNDLRQQFQDGFIGTGYSPRRLSKGSIVVLVVNSDLIVQRVLVMRGFTFLAKYLPQPEFEGLRLAALSAAVPGTRKHASLKMAIDKAAAQIGQLKTTREQAAYGLAKPALA